jgi:hypothetical protein
VRGDCARATVFVKVTPEVAFDVFTREIDLWWRRGPRFRNSGRHAGTLTFEPGVGGRLFETFDADGTPQTVVVGTVTVWEPAARLQFDWRNRNFAPHERTEVEVRFVATPGGTQVSVEHRGWSTLPPDHPARHGQEVERFIAGIALYWGDLLTSLREHVAPK